MSNPNALPLDPARYYDKVLGGWVGKCAGGILGAPIEGYKTFNSIPLSDELFNTNFANDDLDLQVLWLDLVDRLGPWVQRDDLTRHWHDHVAFPWNEYGIATRNISLGLDSPDTGRHNNGYWCESMGSPIRSEIWGMLYPGDADRAAHYARLDSELDHAGFSVHAEQFFSACAALAFVEDDLDRVLRRAIEVVPQESDCAALFGRVGEWYAAYGFATTAAKIKSYYGDADFTSAPMNVGFTLLSLLHAGRDFDRIIESLHLGHDSDCVVATAAALLGILHGNEGIPELWRRRVGNELLISPEVSGIRTPKTLTELAEWTCTVGRRIAAGDYAGPPQPVSLHTEVYTDGFSPQTNAITPTSRKEALGPPGRDDDAGGYPLQLVVKNLTGQARAVNYLLTSPHFGEQHGGLTVEEYATERVRLTPLQPAHPPTESPHYTYTVSLNVDGKTYTYTRGIPYYGEWLLLGPFLRAADALAPMDADYPDHGMSSLPSVRYMNHDRVNGPDEPFLDHAAIQALLSGQQRAEQPFGVTPVAPTSMSMDLGRYFRGRGERTLYLTTQLHSMEARSCWLCLGSTARLTAWVNGEQVLERSEVRRQWPATAHAHLQLQAGENILTLRLDTVVDDYRISVGLKDFAGRHHHQSHWNTSLVFRVPQPVHDRSNALV